MCQDIFRLSQELTFRKFSVQVVIEHWGNNHNASIAKCNMFILLYFYPNVLIEPHISLL